MPEVVQRRFLEVLRAVEQNAFSRNQRKVGSLEEVYIRHGSTEDGKAIGETWSGHAVHEDGQRARRVRQGQDRVCGAARPVCRGAGVA